MPKIAFLVNSLGKGGAERVVTNLATHFLKQGYEVLVVTSRIMQEEYEISSDIIRVDLSQAEDVQGNRVKKILGRITVLENVWKEHRPNIIVSFIGKLNIYAVLSTLKQQIPLILSVRSDPKREYPTPFMRMLSKILFLKTKGVVFQTQDAMDFFTKRLRKKSIILPNPLNPLFIKERYNGTRNNEIVCVGTLNENKNHIMLIKAFANINKEFPNWKIKLYGHGYHDSTEENIKDYALKNGCIEQVEFMGRRTDIHDAIYQSNIFVLTSMIEGMPNALMEAMALGLAVISTDCPCGGPRTLIQEGVNGFLVDVNDISALEKKLKNLMNHPELEERVGKSAQKDSMQYHPDKVNKMWQEYIESKMKKSC